ncbi:MAG: DegT/DnrJ/EryC1/StrS family aminotransferase [Methanothrix sp.]
MKWKIPLFRIYWDDEDIAGVNSVLKRGGYWAAGPEVSEFERELAGYFGSKYAVAFNSGTSALHAAMIAYGLKDGDEVIVPSFTFIATANAPQFVGARPVFAEIEDESLGLDPEDVLTRITPRTRAIIPVHYGGFPCRIKELREIAEDYNLILMEDAAEALGARIDDQKVGTFGDVGILSFCQNKIISTGEGGAIVTDSKRIHKRLGIICSQGRLESQAYFDSSDPGDYIDLGYNFRMPSMIAALGISQLHKADKIAEMRRAKASYFRKRLSGIEGIEVPPEPEGRYHVYQMFTIRVKAGRRDALMNHLSAAGIMTKVYFPPVHLTRFYRKSLGCRVGDLPRTEMISSEVLSLPIYPSMTGEEIDYIAEKIREFSEAER